MFEPVLGTVFAETLTASTRSVSFEVALFAMYIVFESAKHEMKTKHETLLSLWESRALRPGEGPPRPLPRPTLPLRARCTTQIGLMLSLQAASARSEGLDFGYDLAKD